MHQGKAEPMSVGRMDQERNLCARLPALCGHPLVGVQLREMQLCEERNEEALAGAMMIFVY